MEARSAPILCNGRLMCPTLMHLPDDGIVKVWDAVSHFIRRQFALNKGVTIPGLGAFFAVKQERPMAGFKLLDVKMPIFQVSEYFANVHGLPYKKETFPGVPPFVFLNYAWLSLDTGIPRDTVQRCIQETLLFLSYTLAKKQGVDFIFKDIGCLVFRKSRVQMQFSSDFVHNLNSNGQLLKSRLSRTGTMDLATLERKSIVLHPASGGVIVFPRIGLYIPRGRAAGEGPLQAPKGRALEKKGDARVEGESKRTGVLPAIKSQLLTRQSPSLPRLSRATGEAKLGQAAGEKEPSPRLRTARQESSSKMAEEGKGKRSAAAWPQTQAPACEAQRRAGQEICCLYRQEDERTLQASLAEEQLKKERERQHMWEKCKGRGERNGRESIWQKTQTEMQRLQTESASSMALVELKKSLQMVPVDMKQQHVLIPHPPEKKAEAAPLSKSSTNCLSVRSVRVRKQLEKRKEALQKDKTKSRAPNIPGNSAEDLLICVGEKVPVLPVPKMTRASGKPARTPRSCEQLSAQ
ncbi:coiled-coil domain-containing protein 81-like isoform X2 [Cygnus olor]|uniref:coiled-coil domain-containing protein 81-like isoform X2 n=1 Tax=Cygnus olor TaxID=8869 RepID=UPI001ADE62EF|nr:coiled-coil domain-containing protein 81-like isoform X2 [Cygnus olor]